METGEILCCRPSKYIEWKIDDFSDWMRKKHGFIQSPKFSFNGAIWKFQIYTHAELGNSAWVSVDLWRECPDTEEHCTTGWLGMKKGNWEDYVSHSFQHTFDADNQCVEIYEFLLRTSFWRDEVVLTPFNKATFFCSLLSTRQGCKNMETQTLRLKEFGVTGEDESKEADNTWVKGIYRLSEDVKDLFLNETNCDTTIKVANREFHAHRLILGARSPVFASMYTHDTTERSTGIVEIEDCTPEVFQDFLIFLYSGKLESLSWKNATGLYAIADKYDVQEMKEECLTFITVNLCVEHFCEAMTLALKYGESELLKEATDFFVENARKISVTPNWLCFQRDHPVEFNELYIKALERYAPE